MNCFPTIDKKKTGQNIRLHMCRRGLCVNDIREELHLGSVQCIYHWMSGRSLPTLDNLLALSLLLDVRVEDILEVDHSAGTTAPH